MASTLLLRIYKWPWHLAQGQLFLVVYVITIPNVTSSYKLMFVNIQPRNNENQEIMIVALLLIWPQAIHNVAWEQTIQSEDDILLLLPDSSACVVVFFLSVFRYWETCIMSMEETLSFDLVSIKINAYNIVLLGETKCQRLVSNWVEILEMFGRWDGGMDGGGWGSGMIDHSTGLRCQNFTFYINAAFGLTNRCLMQTLWFLYDACNVFIGQNLLFSKH